MPGSHIIKASRPVGLLLNLSPSLFWNFTYLICNCISLSVWLFQTLSVCEEWKNLHRFPCGGPQQSQCPCTGLAARGDEDFVTVGEDGRICLMNMAHRAPTRTIGGWGYASLTYTSACDPLVLTTNAQIGLRNPPILWYLCVCIRVIVN